MLSLVNRPSKILHKHCFHFLLGLAMVPRENKSNTFAEFWRDKTKSIMVFLKVAYSCPFEFTVESRSLLEIILNCHNWIKIIIKSTEWHLFLCQQIHVSQKKGHHTRLDFMTTGTPSGLVLAAGFKQERFSMVFACMAYGQNCI